MNLYTIFNFLLYFAYGLFFKNQFILPSKSNCFSEFKYYNKQIVQEIKIDNFFGYFDNFKNKYGDYEILKFWILDNDNFNLTNAPLSISIIRNTNSFLSLDDLPHDYYLPLVIKKI